MKYYCKELNQEFETKEELYQALRDNHEFIISEKKAKVYNSKKGDNKGAIKVIPIHKQMSEAVKELDMDEAYHYIAVNTTLILDSHKDVSINGSWNKTAKDQKGKVYLVLDHEFGVTTTVVKKEHIELMVAKLSFSDLGKSYEGETEALIYKFRKDKVINQLAKEWLESGDDIEASVRLRYIKIVFCLNSDADEDKTYKKNYLKYIDTIANKDDFESIDYFWAVTEQQNVLESSLVLAGSNPVTGVVSNSNKKEPLKNTPPNTEEPLKDTLEKKQRDFYLNFN